MNFREFTQKEIEYEKKLAQDYRRKIKTALTASAQSIIWSKTKRESRLTYLKSKEMSSMRLNFANVLKSQYPYWKTILPPRKKC